MSFSENPFTNMEVVSNEDGTVGYRCSSCGGGWREKWQSSVAVLVLRRAFDSHLKNSHDRSPEHFEGYGGGY